MEDLRLALQVHRELNLHRTLNLLLRHLQQLLDDLRQREGLELQLRGKGHNTRAVGITRIDNTHVFTVIRRRNHLQTLKLIARMYRESLQVDRIVNRGLELLRAERKRQHRLLRLAHRQINGRGLQHVLGVLGTEAQHLFAIHYHFA